MGTAQAPKIAYLSYPPKSISCLRLFIPRHGGQTRSTKKSNLHGCETREHCRWHIYYYSVRCIHVHELNLLAVHNVVRNAQYKRCGRNEETGLRW